MKEGDLVLFRKWHHLRKRHGDLPGTVTMSIHLPAGHYLIVLLDGKEWTARRGDLQHFVNKSARKVSSVHPVN